MISPMYAGVRIGARMGPELRAGEPGARDKIGTRNREQDRNQGPGPRTGVKGQKARTRRQGNATVVEHRVSVSRLRSEALERGSRCTASVTVLTPVLVAMLTKAVVR